MDPLTGWRLLGVWRDMTADPGIVSRERMKEKPEIGRKRTRAFLFAAHKAMRRKQRSIASKALRRHFREPWQPGCRGSGPVGT